MSETTLLPCPICGRKATISSWWSSDEECGVASVGCSRESYSNGYECARIHIMRVDEKTAREDAIRIWNTRAELASWTCPFARPTDLTDGCAAFERIAELEAAHGTLTAEQVRGAIKQYSFGIQPELGYGEFGRCFHDKSWQAIADELNALLGSGTCDAIADEHYYRGINGVCEGIKCSNCGEPLSSKFKHCPWCGARIRKAVER